MKLVDVALSLSALVALPVLLTFVVARVKALWGGRVGPPLMQLPYDLLRLTRKRPVLATTTTAVFRIAPSVVLVSSLAAALLVPLAGGPALVSFPYDFVCLAYVWGLGRAAQLLAALDTGSAFAGLGAAREATFSALLEPALLLVTGALTLLGSTSTLAAALSPTPSGPAEWVAWAAAVIALFVVLQVETARLPVDDPATHLELTMVHEAMLLDHSGPDLAAAQLSGALKLATCASALATLLCPWRGLPAPLAAVVHVGGCVAVAALVGTIESLFARLKLRTVPHYVLGGLSAATVALLATAWRGGAP